MVQDIFLPLPNGAMVRDRYIIEGLLGKGGFGSVYLVKDRRVKGNLFALKEVIDPSKQERDRFTLEGEILRRLDHPGLPRVYHAFSDDAMFRAYLLMDYIEGPNLEILRQKQAQHRLPLMQVMRIMAPIIEAIAYLHSQQPPIIHRDIKPSNIIVLPAGNEAVLVDFGIAKEYEADSTTTSVRRCSPGYGAPEQYGSGTDTRTDIYGLAATFYALLTGKIPADSFQRMLQLGSKGVDPLVPIIQHMPDIPLLVSEAIQRAMSIDSNDRFATIGEFWQALQDGLPVLTNADGDVQSIVSAASLSSSLLAEDDFLLLASIEEGENAPRAQQVISTDLLQGGDAYT
ncbi:MAG: serine/threonine protein kinase, partial [Ktedonobacteraceae bacterium]